MDNDKRVEIIEKSEQWLLAVIDLSDKQLAGMRRDGYVNVYVYDYYANGLDKVGVFARLHALTDAEAQTAFAPKEIKGELFGPVAHVKLEVGV